MSLTFKKTHQIFLLSKALIIVAQLIATAYVILWNIDFWKKITPEITVLFEQSGFVSNLDKAFSLIIPFLISLGIYFLCLISLSIVRKIILNIRVKPKSIVYYENTGEIHPLFARRIANHYNWYPSLTLEVFFNFYKESISQEYILKNHQQNKEFYELLCKYNHNLNYDLPYQDPNSTIIRREQFLDESKIDPVSD